MATMGVAILKLLRGTELKELNRSLKAYLAPLVGHSGSGREHIGEKEQHILAKEYVPFLVQLLKICGAKLASIPSTDDLVAASMADELFSAMVVAINGLSQLRSQLTGSSFEMELQRYGLVRRLMAWKRYGAALSQLQVLFRSLCRITSLQDSKVCPINQVTSGRTSKGGTIRAPHNSQYCFVPAPDLFVQFFLIIRFFVVPSRSGEKEIIRRQAPPMRGFSSRPATGGRHGIRTSSTSCCRSYRFNMVHGRGFRRFSIFLADGSTVARTAGTMDQVQLHILSINSIR